ncbi:transposable element Tcb2 transposase [Trichonephila clavipes]|nr:transposable element Tcb2 transposase [Trichonephila clavipes]
MYLTCQQGCSSWWSMPLTSVMVRGMCSWHDMGPLICLDTTLTVDRHARILPDHLDQFMSIVNSDGLEEFQQDNVTPHTFRIASEWLQEHSFEFRHFHWPPKSLDMNIIECIWDALQHALQQRSPPPLTPTDLKASPVGFMVSITSSTTSGIN